MTKWIRNLGGVIVDELRYAFIRYAFHATGRGEGLLYLGRSIKPFRYLCKEYMDYSVAVDAPFSLHDEGRAGAQALEQALPCQDGILDVVLCAEVLEHVPEPVAALRETGRVLKSGGRLFLTAPFRVPLHEVPGDFYRYTMHGLRHLREQLGLHIELLRPFSGLTGVTLCFLVQAQLKIWYLVWKAVKLQGVHTIYNPFIFLLVDIPRWAYLNLLRFANWIPAMKTVHDRLTYTTKGYGLVALQ